MRRLTLAVALVAALLSTQARADAVQVALLSAVTTTGAGSSVQIVGGSSLTSLWVQASGTYGVGTTVQIQASQDGTTWTNQLPDPIATGEQYVGRLCEPCLYRANVSAHEGGGKTVTIRIGVSAPGQVKVVP